MEEILNRLSEEQAQIALEVARKAKDMGIDPRLAVALAYRESGFNPEAVGGAGEIGLMQVKPSTAEMLGFSADDLKDPAKNIDIGLTYLKQGLEKFGDPVLAAAGYNAGHNHPYFTDPERAKLPDSTKQYLRSIADLGGFAKPAGEEPAEEAPAAEPASEGDFQAQKARMAADLLGMAGGAALGKGLDVAKNVGATGQAIRQIPELMRAGVPGMPTAAPTGAPTGAPAGGLGMRPPVAGGPAGPVGGPVSPLQQMGGSGAYNYGKAFGLTDIEAARALDMSKQPGGASDLINRRRAAMEKIQQMGGGFTENPRYGGIMTPTPGAGGGPRASYVQGAGGMSKLPPTQAIPSAPLQPPKPSPLAQAGQMAGRGAGAVLRSPVAMGALGGLSAAEGAQEFQKRVQEGDTTGAALAGAQGVGGALQMMPSPKLRAVGAMISTISPLTQYLRDKIRNQPEMPEPTPEEMELAKRPAFVYPSP
jgi:Transglycosylase SLT domain